MWFPTVVQKWTARGKLQGEFWHNGGVLAIEDARVLNRHALLVGATNNEHFAASLAVLDGSDLRGAAPAANPKYRCGDCGAGEPLVYLIFARTELSRVLGTRPYTHSIRRNSDGSITVLVAESFGKRPNGASQQALVVYQFDSDLRLFGAEFSDNYRMIHDELKAAGTLEDCQGLGQEEKLLQVLSWNGFRFLPLPMN
jgi:hypothetical protein